MKVVELSLFTLLSGGQKCETGEERGSDSNGEEKGGREGQMEREEGGGRYKPGGRNVRKERGGQTIKHCLPVLFPMATYVYL